MAVRVRRLLRLLLLVSRTLIPSARVPPKSGKSILPTLPASVSRQLVAVNLVSAVGKSVT